MYSKVEVALLLGSVLLLAACATPEQRAAQARQQQYQAAQAQRNAIENRRIYLVGLGKKCVEYGFKTGTTAYAQCIQNAEQQNEAFIQNQNAINYQQSQQDRQNLQNAFQPLIDFDKNTRELFKK